MTNTRKYLYILNIVALFFCITFLFSVNVYAAGNEIKDGISFGDMKFEAGKVASYEVNQSLINNNDIVKYTWYIDDSVVSNEATYILSGDDVEKFIKLRVDLSNGDYAQCSGYFSIFPVLYIDSKSSYSSVYRTSVDANLHLTGVGYENDQLYEGSAKIKVRGNTTRWQDKKPFKVKLDKKADIFGMGKSKHWVLLADALDISLVRNKLIQEMAKELGLNAMDSKLITLIYNGSYYGVYELSEHVRIGKSRVDIFDWEELAEDAAKAIEKQLIIDEELDLTSDLDVVGNVKEELATDFTWVESENHEFKSAFLKKNGMTDIYDMSQIIDFDEKVPSVTGGFLLETDFWFEKDNNIKPNILTAYGTPIHTNTPEYTVKFDGLTNYIKEYVQAMEYAVHSTDFIYKNADTHYQVTNEGTATGSGFSGVQYGPVEFTSDKYDGWHYTDFIDFDSALNYMLKCELAMNWDGMKCSVFMYKDIEGKLIFGPPWDYDWTWGNGIITNTNFPEVWHTTSPRFAKEQYYQTVQWNRYFIRDPYFIVRLYERYHEVRDSIIEPMVTTKLQTMKEDNRVAGEKNVERWGGAFLASGGQTYDEQFKVIENFLGKRIPWLDEQFESIDSLMTSLGYYVTSDKIATESCDIATKEGYSIVKVKVSDSNIAKISFQINGNHMYESEVIEDYATLDIPDDIHVKEKDKYNVIQYRAIGSDGKYIVNDKGTSWGNYTNAISNYYVFKKEIKEPETEMPTEEIKEEKPMANPVVGAGNEGIETDNQGSKEGDAINKSTFSSVLIISGVILCFFTIIVLVKNMIRHKKK